ncbi:MAG: MBL fold metallo-hydrolase [Emergencia sp.]
MSLQFCSFASGSSGNSYLVKSENTSLLVDVGIAGKRILEGLEGKGLQPEELSGILLTHEHVDHVRSLRMMSRKAACAKIYASGGTLAQVSDLVEPGKGFTVQAGEPFMAGDIEVRPFDLSHDAAQPTGYSFVHEGRQLTIITDTGYVTAEMEVHIASADLLVLEANHEVNILKMGSYPYPLKRRILGEKGHLSNEAAGECLCRMLDCRRADPAGRECGRDVPAVVLAHLSRENNTPDQAWLTIRNILFESDYYIDRDLTMTIAYRDEAGPFLEV